MKIIGVDNFNRDTVNDVLIAENIKNVALAKIMCQALNDNGGENSSLWYRVVPDEYVLETNGER
jgi:hypothetical protein